MSVLWEEEDLDDEAIEANRTYKKQAGELETKSNETTSKPSTSATVNAGEKSIVSELSRSKSMEEMELNYLTSMLSLEHGCESNFCARNLKVKERPESQDLINIVFVCDFCFKMASDLWFVKILVNFLINLLI